MPTDQPDLSEKVIYAVAKRSGTDPLDLPSLNDAVDADALDRLFESRTSGTSDRFGAVQFRYNGYEVLVDSDGDVSLDSVIDSLNSA